MRSVDNFIVQINQLFKSKIGDSEVFLSSVFRDKFSKTKVGKVLANPIETPGFIVNPDEFVWFSHLVTNRQVVRGAGGVMRKLDSEFMFDRVKNIYAVPSDMIYAYTDNGQVLAAGSYFFAEPIRAFKPGTKLWTPSDNSVTSTYSIGINEGDLILHEKNSEYKVEVLGKEVYRMKNREVYAKVI
jgi:hypothetical protein